MHPHTTKRGRSSDSPTFRIIPHSPPDQDAQGLREAHIYVRVSTYDQAQEGFSLPRQFEVCRKQADVDGHEVKPENELHDIDSGAKFDRTYLTQILVRVRQGRVSALYCPEVDRLARDVRDGLEILEILRAHNTKLVLVKDRIDTSTDHGEMFFVMMLMFAKWERKQIKERTWGGRLKQMEVYHRDGKPASAGSRSIPYGYAYAPPEEKGQDGTWSRIPEQTEWVLYIYEQAALGRGTHTIARFLNDKDISSPTGTTWNQRTIANIIRSTTYIGQMKRKLGGREFTFSVPPSVPEPLWQQANAMLDANKRLSRRNGKHEYLLSGMLRCLTCHQGGHEHMMHGTVNTKGVISYRCDSYQDGHRVQHNVVASKIETAVWDYIYGVITDAEQVTARLARLKDAASAEYRGTEDEIADLEAQLAANSAAQARVAELYARGKLKKAILENQEVALEQEAADLEGKLALKRVQLQQAQQDQLPLQSVVDACQLLREGLDVYAFERKRWLLRMLIASLYADKEGWQLELRLPGLAAAEGHFSAPTLRSRSGRHSP